MTTQHRRARDFQRREAEILAAASGLFNSDAWQHVTIEQIAHAVEIGKGTIYKHFASKDEIYARLAIDFHLAALGELEQIDGALPVLERLREVLRLHWRRHCGTAEVQRVVQHCDRSDFRQALSAPTRARFEAVDAAFGEVLYGLLQEGVARGLLPERPLHALLFGVQATLFGAIRHGHRCRAQSADLSCAVVPGSDEQCEETIDFIMAGLSCSMSVAA